MARGGLRLVARRALTVTSHESKERAEMPDRDRSTGVEVALHLHHAVADVLSERDEQDLLEELAACRRKLAAGLASLRDVAAPGGADDPQATAQFRAQGCLGDGRDHARLGAVHRRYAELRDTLAMANMRLVAHIAKQFRDRGIPYPDLLQEGFCGLLAAIDRFDTARETRLATYATWWIRNSMQTAVAAGAYPVRLTPRHLRRLARNQDQLDLPRPAGDSSHRPSEPSDVLRSIHSATRPTVSLDAGRSRDSALHLTQALGVSDAEAYADVDGDGVRILMDSLGPRERQVLSLRFGLGGGERLSLSQVGGLLAVSKERIRQIQESALKKLRDLIERQEPEVRSKLGLQTTPGRPVDSFLKSTPAPADPLNEWRR